MPWFLNKRFQVLISLMKKKDDARIAEERAAIKYQKDHMYDDLHTEDNMQASNNQDRDSNFEDDFM